MKLQAFLALVTYPDASADAVAAHAVAIAARLDAALHARVMIPDFPPVSNTLSRLLLDLPKVIEDTEAASRGRGAHLLARVREAAAAAGIEVTAGEVTAPLAGLADAAAVQARYHDVGLVGWEAGNAASQMTAEAVIFGSGRPAVLLPELWDIAATDHVAVAWDGSRAAARAVADAQPFLSRAARITVLTVTDEKPLQEKNPGERLAEGLRRRSLPAEAVALRTEDCPIGEALQQRAIERGCNLLVMGGYGHSRIRDFVLGGATKGVLGNLLMPVLLSH